MDAVQTTPTRKGPQKPAFFDLGKHVERLVECAGEAFVLAILVQIVGSIVVEMVGGLWREMTPTLPPGLAGQPLAESASSWVPNLGFFHQHRLALIFWGIFIIKIVGALAGGSRSEQPRRAAAWLTKIYQEVSERWFGLVVVNAFLAFIGAWLTQVAQQFSMTSWFWYLLAACLKPAIEAVAGLFNSTGPFRTASDLAAWFTANQVRFTFWLLYWGAIADDLGLPNFKTLGRLIWRRWCRRSTPSPAAERDALSRINSEDNHG
jgi:hypothetical protein